jgi:hypothetical protein
MNTHDLPCSAELTGISSDELADVSGGCASARSGGGNPFQGVANFFSNLFAPVINGVKGHIGGGRLAKKMYGQPTRGETASGRQIMTDYFAGRFDPPARTRR